MIAAILAIGLVIGYRFHVLVIERDDARTEAEAANELLSELMRPTLQALDTRPVAAVLPFAPRVSGSGPRRTS